MNNKRILWLTCLILGVAVVASARSQDPQGRGQGQRPKPELTAWWDQPIVRDLGLSDEQNRQIRATVAESRDRLIVLRGAVDSAEAVLRDLMNEDKVDTRKAEAAIEKVVTTHAEMMRAVSEMSLRLRVILTAEQWQELQKRESQPPPPQPGQPQRKKEPTADRPAPPHVSAGGEQGWIAWLFERPNR